VSAVGRKSGANAFLEVRNRKATFILAEVPKISPLERAEVRRVALWQMIAQKSSRTPQVPFVPSLLNEVHVSGVAFCAHELSFSLNPPRRARRTPGQCDGEQSDRTAEQGESGFTAAPAP
jgi:hypothetical protein